MSSRVQEMKEEKEYYTVKDCVNKGLGSQAAIYSLFNSKTFPAIRVGKSGLRVRKSDLDKWVEAQLNKI